MATFRVTTGGGETGGGETGGAQGGRVTTRDDVAGEVAAPTIADARFPLISGGEQQAVTIAISQAVKVGKSWKIVVIAITTAVKVVLSTPQMLWSIPQMAQ